MPSMFSTGSPGIMRGMMKHMNTTMKNVRTYLRVFPIT